MRIVPVLLVLVMWLGIRAQAQTELLLPVREHEKWGYCDTTGALRIPLQFELAGLFHENGLASVKKDGNVYLINQAGEIITEGKCRDIKIIGKDLYACYNGSEWKLHGAGLKTVPPDNIRALEPGFSNWVFYTPKGSGVMDRKGNILFAPEYDQIEPSQEYGYYIVTKDSLMGVLHENGQTILPTAYYFSDFREPGFIMFTGEGKWGIVSLNRKIETDTIYTDVQTDPGSPFVLLYDTLGTTAYHIDTGKKFACDSLTRLNFYDEDYLLVFLPDGLNLLDSNMRYVFPKQYASIQRQTEGFIVSEKGLFGFCNEKGREVHKPRYTFITSVVNGTAITGIDKRRGAIHVSGTVLAEPEFDKAEIFAETAKMYSGAAVTTVDFTEDGKILDRSTYQNFKTIKIGGFKDRRQPNQTSDATVPSVWFFDSEKRKWGLNSAQGDELLAPQFDQVNRWDVNLSRVGIRHEGSVTIAGVVFTFDNLWGLVNNQTGDVIVPPRYIDIRPDTGYGKAVHTVILTDAFLNFFIKDTLTHRPYGPFSWIGKSNGDTRPVATGGQWELLNPDTGHTHRGTLDKFLAANFSPNLFSRRTLGRREGQVVLTGASYTLWDDRKQGVYKDLRFRYISDYTQKYAVAGQGEKQMGIIDAYGQPIVPLAYNYVEIIQHKNSVFFLKYNKRETFGFIKRSGSWAFEQKFPKLGHFNDGKAFMGSDEKGVICTDTLGQLHYLPNTSRHGYFSEGMVPVRGKRHWYYLSSDFDTLLENSSWNWLGQFSHGLAPVRIHSTYHYINTAGNRVFKHDFTKALPYSERGLALVRKNENWGLINTKGEYVIKPKYNQGKFIAKDSIYCFSSDKGWHLYRADGTPLLKKPVSMYRPFIDGQCLVSFNNGNRAVLHKSGQLTYPPKDTRLQAVQGSFLVIYPPETGIRLSDMNFNPMWNNDTYSSFKFGGEGMVFARKRREGWVLIGKGKGEIYSLPGTPLSPFVEGYAVLRMPNGQCMFIDKEGEQAFGMFFLAAKPFNNGTAMVRMEHGWGVLDLSGQFIISPKYKFIGPFKEGFAPVQMESSISISNRQDQPIVDGQYDAVVLERCGYFRIESADKVGWIARDGRIVWNPAR